MGNLSLFSLVIFCAMQAAWSEPLREIECTTVPIERSKVHRNSDNSIFQSTFSPTLDWVSTNWSGYVAAKDLVGSSCSNGTVTQVSGSWVVPTLSPTSDSSYCAIWVGIDGYHSSTVEQIGTSHDWNGSQENYAWFEMYPEYPKMIKGFPVHNGDVISASVEYIGNNTFQMQISNHTQGVYTTISNISATTNALCNSAEWVVEAPYSNGFLPLSDFGAVTWTDCSATIKGTTGSIDGGWWVSENLTMMSTSGKTEASTSSLSGDGSGFQVTWVAE